MYAPQGALAEDIHGYVSGGFGGITETWGYNNDLEPTSVSASSTAGSALSLSYGFANNGSVTSIGNGNDSGRNESISYDPLDRVLQAQTAATSGQDCWGLNFGTGGLADDTLGNLLSMGVFKCSGPSLSVSVNGNNQISSSGFSYDADGDMTGDALYSYAFNGANEITSANGVNYTGACPERSRRDGDALYASRMALRDGLRVEISSGTLYWRAYTRQVIETTDYSGKICFTANYYAGVYPDIFVGARYYNPRLGRPDALTDTGRSALSEPDRFMSPDLPRCRNKRGAVRVARTGPLGGWVGNPQSLDGYAYVRNGPTTFTGPAEMPETFGALGSRRVSSPLQAMVSGLVVGGSGGAPGAQSTLSAAPAQAGVTVPSPTAVANAEAMLAEFVADYLSLRPSPSSPYGSGFSQACQASGSFGAGFGNTTPGLKPGGCSLSIPASLNYGQAQSYAGASYFIPSGTGSVMSVFLGVSLDLQQSFTLYNWAVNGSSAGLGSMNGNLGFAVDPGFPSFDVNMFFGGGGGFSGNGECGVGGWNDVCSL